MANKDHLIDDESQLGPNWVPVNAAPIVPGRTVAAPSVGDITPTVPQYSAGSLPPSFQQNVDFVNTQQPTPNDPHHSLMPLGLSGNSVSSAQITSVVKSSQALVGNTLVLETNSIQNPNQNLLNIEGGANVTVSSDASGGVTISATGSTANKIEFHDHFTFGNPVDNTGAFIGELGWSGQNGPITGLSKFLCMGSFPNLGQIQLYPSSATANAGGAMVPPSVWAGGRADPGDTNSGLSSRWPLLDYPGWTATWVFRLARPNYHFAETSAVAFNVTKLSLYVGFANGATTSSPPLQISQRPNVFYGVRFDTDTTSPSIADTTFHLEACQNALNSSSIVRYNNVGTGGGSFDTTIVPSENVFYTLTMSYLSANSMFMSFTDGTTTMSTTFTLTPLSMSGLNGGGFSIAKSVGLVSLPVGPSSFTNLIGSFGFGTNSKATISGMSGGFAVYNGTQRILDADEGTSNTVYFKDPTGGSIGNPGTFTVTSYSALFPYVGIANDTTGGAPGGSRCVAVDEFHFTWN